MGQVRGIDRGPWIATRLGVKIRADDGQQLGLSWHSLAKNWKNGKHHTRHESPPLLWKESINTA